MSVVGENVEKIMEAKSELAMPGRRWGAEEEEGQVEEEGGRGRWKKKGRWKRQVEEEGGRGRWKRREI